jgi:glycosyltransferase involved in cell wall biosynthesis
MTERARPLLRGHVERTIRKSLDGLNHIFFFGEADRKQAILRYGLDQARTSVFQFGIDTEFWCTKLSSAKTSKILAVGSDPSRDYDTLLKAETSWPLQILTRLPVLVPEGRQNVNIVYGSMPASALTDIELRDLYRSAAIVAVPLKDVWQPSGQSVTMQAMACGCPVVLTRGRGLWDPAVFVDGENCLLVPPGDASAWTQALGRLAQDPDLRERIGEAARRTVETHFALDRMNASATALVQNNWER